MRESSVRSAVGLAVGLDSTNCNNPTLVYSRRAIFKSIANGRSRCISALETVLAPAHSESGIDARDATAFDPPASAEDTWTC